MTSGLKAGKVLQGNVKLLTNANIADDSHAHKFQGIEGWPVELLRVIPQNTRPLHCVVTEKQRHGLSGQYWQCLRGSESTLHDLTAPALGIDMRPPVPATLLKGCHKIEASKATGEFCVVLGATSCGIAKNCSRNKAKCVFAIEAII